MLRPTVPRRSLPLLAVCFLTLLASAPPLGAADWASWRGPAYDGTAADTAFAGRDAFGLEVAWRRELGSGYSAVVVAGDTAVTMFSDHERDFVVALDAATGSERWRFALGPTYGGHSGSEDGPSGTPTVAGGRVFALAPHGALHALDLATGEPAWQVDLAARYGAPEPRFGFTGPPLAVDRVVVVAAGAGAAGDGSTFVAFDAATGAERWRLGDDTVSYEAPVVAELGGRRQILGLSNHRLTGIDPATGDAWWSSTFHEGQTFGTAQVVPLDDDRLLLRNGRETVLYRFAGDDAEPPLVELWRNEALASGLSVAVVVDDHVYGYAGNFLTCLRLADGEKVWKSRPPGGTGLIALDGNLLTVGKGGDLVAVAARPGGFVERARVNVLDDAGVTYPTYALDLVFVRNTREIAAVRVTAPQPVAEQLAEPAHAFEALVRRASAAADPRAAVRTFMRAQAAVPIIEGDWVHFVFWAAAEDVAIVGTMTPDAEEEGMARIPGTDFFHRSYRLPPDGRAEYWLTVDFENRIADPIHPRRVAYGRWWWDFEISELRMPGYRAPAWAEGGAPPANGTVETFTWASAVRDNERQVAVYLPPGYADADVRFPVTYFLHGDLWHARGELPAMLDRAIHAGVVPPLVAVFLGRPEGPEAWQEMSFDQPRDAWVRALVEELVPDLDARYRLATEPAQNAVVGRLAGTRAALEVAFGHGDRFGHAVAISAEWPTGTLPAMLEAAGAVPKERRPTVAVRWNHSDQGAPPDGTEPAGDTVAAISRAFADGLAALGYAATQREAADASGWWSWNLLAIEALGEAWSER